MDYRQEVGSYTAKGGFQNEMDIVMKFENWSYDSAKKRRNSRSY